MPGAGAIWVNGSPCLPSAGSNLLSTPDLHWEAFLALHGLFAHTGMRVSITATAGEVPAALFSMAACELYQRLNDQLNGEM